MEMKRKEDVGPASERNEDDTDELVYFGEIDAELVKVHDAAVAAIIAIDTRIADVRYAHSVKVHLQAAVKFILEMGVVELDARKPPVSKKAVSARSDFVTPTAKRLADRPPCQDRGPRQTNKKQPK